MVSIIGAGPVGNYLASKLSAEGVKVDVYEEHSKVGVPIACTGILTSYLSDFVKVSEDYVVNKIDRTDVYSPNGSSVSIKLKKNFIVDRTLFDSHFAEVAESNGAKIHVNRKLVSLNNGLMKFQKGRDVRSEVIVGADGPNSVVGRSAGIFGDRNFVVGHQARVKLKEKIDSNVVEFFLNEGNYIGWLVPEDERVVRLGVASHVGTDNYFNELLKKRNGKVLGWQSGVIPVYDPKLKIEKDNVFLVGDAATQVKATTYGGIIPGMHAADVLKDVILNGGSYTKCVKKTIGKSLKTHLHIRKLMNKFSKDDYNELVKLCNKDSVKKLIYEHDREYPKKLLTSLLLKEPRFLKFIRF
ncbi:NAD(P)/FAD-dependent oxidoreductase [Candidatus Woesearchaeota archaeon]|nr:NAD(P)/FAD-dependent oxidoreductase [Candidatus Woesearchaeota archaeon]MBT6044564.1 NAD(P)/FAD-dependent oxidoreductase [Candidatus Woesearchaeota archaeon]